MDTTIDDPLLGALVDGRYRVRTRVARGGMATVYTAVDERLERTVALKIIHPAQANDPSFVERFTDEAKTIARLTHPNVVAVYDQGSYQGLAYLVMEYVRGRTLRELLIERRQLRPQDALAILEQMLAAIAAAHRAGLVHRDVKPENVLVCEAPGDATNLLDSVVKVADFGLARAVEASAEGTGHLMATVAYVAPELVANGHADPRTDVYSSGIVLFEMLTGRVPYEAKSVVDVAWRHVREDVPPPSQLVPGLSPALDALVARATSRDPAGRPTDAGAMYTEVQQVREGLGAALAEAQVMKQHTMVVPRIDAGDPRTGTHPTGPGPGHYGATGDRPPWSRLPSSTRGGPVAAVPAQPHRRAAPGPRDRVAPLVARVKADPKVRLTVIAALAALAMFAAFGVWWLGVGRYDTAPSLVSLPKAQAIAQAQRAGFTVKLGSGRFDEKAAKDTVLEQRPAAGERIVSGGSITITLSKGPQRYEMPDFTGKSYELAERELKQLNITPKRTEVYDDNIPANSVVATEPVAGAEIKAGTQVTVQVSKGRAPITVPNVVDKNVNDATNILTRAELTVEVKEQESTKPKDQVLAQDPIDGAGAERGAKVTLTVSKGPPYVVVPDVRNMNLDEATRALQALGLQVQAMGGGNVRFQDPQPGTQVPPGTQVRIFALG